MLRDQLPLERFVTVPARSVKSGFCATDFPENILESAGVASVKQFAEERPFWLESKNKITDESIVRPMNPVARRLDLAEKMRDRRKT